MKHLFFCFFYLFSLNAYSAITPDLSGNSHLTLKARVTDTYVWSNEEYRYSLENSKFTYKVFKSDEDSNPAVDYVEQQGGFTDSAHSSHTTTRYLSVSLDQVRFESVREGKMTKHAVLQAQLSDDKEKLQIYFSEQRKDDILSGLVTAADVKFDLQREQQGSSSNYSCEVKNKKLVCTIDYLRVASGLEVKSLPLTSQKIN